MDDIDFLDLCRVVADHLPASDLEREFRERIAEAQEAFDELDCMVEGIVAKVDKTLEDKYMRGIE